MKKMKMSKTLMMLGLTFILALFVSCTGTEVKPNYYGVLKENYGKNGKSDYSLQMGNVNDRGAGTTLFQVPAFEQRAEFFTVAGDPASGKRILHLLSKDNTALTCSPLYSYSVLKERAIDVVFENSHLSTGDDGKFMLAIQGNMLEPIIYDCVKEQSRMFGDSVLMGPGGSLVLEQKVQDIIKQKFDIKGFKLIEFSINLDFSEKVKAKIDDRNEVNANTSVIDQQILQQKKKNELAQLEKEFNKIQSEGLTEAILKRMFIEKWDGKTQLYSTPWGTMPMTMFKNQ